MSNGEVWDGLDFEYFTLSPMGYPGKHYGEGRNQQHELYSIAQRAYVEKHIKDAKAAGVGEYKKGYNYKKVCEEFAESVKA